MDGWWGREEVVIQKTPQQAVQSWKGWWDAAAGRGWLGCQESEGKEQSPRRGCSLSAACYSLLLPCASSSQPSFFLAATVGHPPNLSPIPSCPAPSLQQQSSPFAFSLSFLQQILLYFLFAIQYIFSSSGFMCRKIPKMYSYFGAVCSGCFWDSFAEDSPCRRMRNLFFCSALFPFLSIIFLQS